MRTPTAALDEHHAIGVVQGALRLRTTSFEAYRNSCFCLKSGNPTLLKGVWLPVPEPAMPAVAKAR